MVHAHAPAPRSSVDWAEAKTSGVISELSLLTPITPGRIPGERRTYEERLRDHLESLQRREAASIPSFVRPITRIHFARWLILRPEQYLQYSRVPGVEYHEDHDGRPPPDGLQHTPAPIDDYREEPVSSPTDSEVRREPSQAPSSSSRPLSTPHLGSPRFFSWLLFVVTFDGDLKSYVRHVVQTIGEDVDRVWGNCYQYPGTKDFERFWLYARRHQINTDVFYAAYPSLTAPRVQQLRVFKDRFDDFIARTRKPDGTSRDDIGPLLDEFLRANLQYTMDFPAYGGTYDAA